MSQKKYVVRLTDAERRDCREVIAKLKGTSQKVRRANILLQADVDGPGWTDRRIAEAYHCRVRTVEEVRRRLCEDGFEQTLEGKKREHPPVPKKLDGRQEAELIALRLGPPPAGFASWSLERVAERAITLGLLEPGQSISRELVRRTLKKTA